MNKAKGILYKHAKSNGCKSDLLRNPFLEQAVLNAINEALTIPVVMHRCKLVDYGDEEKRCVKCGYITWNNDKTDNEIIEDMINAGYDVPNCDNGA